jgi:hypothetical protein
MAEIAWMLAFLPLDARPGPAQSQAMEALFPLLLIGLAILVPLFGADTRDGRDWQPRPDARWRWR